MSAYSEINNMVKQAGWYTDWLTSRYKKQNEKYRVQQGLPAKPFTKKMSPSGGKDISEDAVAAIAADRRSKYRGYLKPHVIQGGKMF